MNIVRKATGFAIICAVSAISACQTTNPSYVPVSQASNCMEITNSFNANYRQAREACAGGWELAGPFYELENPFLLIPDPIRPVTYVTKMTKFDARYCTPMLRANYWEAQSAWSHRMCNTYPRGEYKHMSVEEAKLAKQNQRGIFSTIPPQEQFLNRMDYTIDDPILGCMGDNCLD